MRNHRLSRQGFTLVELSIVLVIIGLLIGGILVGQSLIDSVKSSRLLQTMKQVEVFSSVYKQRFRKLPGDDNAAQQKFGASKCGGGCNGNGDGVILGSSGTTTFEGVRFWHHLKLSGILEGSGIDIIAPTSLLGTWDGNAYLAAKYIPEFKDIEKNLSIIGLGNPSVYSGLASCAEAMIIGKATYTSSTPGGMINGYHPNALNSKYVKYLDNKIDDYNPYTGKIMADNVSVSGCLGASGYRTGAANGYQPVDQQCNIFWCMDK